MKICICNLLSILLIYPNLVQSSPRPSNPNDGNRNFVGYHPGTTFRVFTENTGSSPNPGQQLQPYAGPTYHPFNHDYRPNLGMTSMTPYGSSFNPHATSFQPQSAPNNMLLQQQFAGLGLSGSPFRGYSPAHPSSSPPNRMPIQQPFRGSSPGPSHQPERPSLAVFPNSANAVVRHGKNGKSYVNDIPGKFVLDAFIPLHRKEIKLTQEKASQSYIHTLTAASYKNGELLPKPSDLLFREGDKFAMYRGNDKSGNWYLDNGAVQPGQLIPVSPGPFDVLSRKRKLFGEFDDQKKKFYRYILPGTSRSKRAGTSQGPRPEQGSTSNPRN